MPSVSSDTSLRDFQNFVKEVYGQSNDRYFNWDDMAANVERFIMRGLKGIRKGDRSKTLLNMLVAQSWFMSLLNQLHIDLEAEVWQRFPYACSYCGSCPCQCQSKKAEERLAIKAEVDRQPKTLRDLQAMFRAIYPPEKRRLEDAGIHLAEEAGELSEALLAYRGSHEDKNFAAVALEAADLFSCFVGVLNSLDADMTDELAKMFHDNCHVCHQAPCVCGFSAIIGFKS